MHGRKKRSVTIDLKAVGAREIILELVAHCDVVVENLLPGQLERMGLGPDVLRSVWPDLIVSHISGYGQTGQYRDRAALGVIGEAIGGRPIKEECRVGNGGRRTGNTRWALVPKKQNNT